MHIFYGQNREKNKIYSAEFKIRVITVRKYELGNDQTGGARLMVQRWERIFLEEGAEGLMKERRGRACAASGTRKGRPPKLDKADKYNKVKQEISDIFTANKGRYGYRRILSILKQKGYTINHKTVLKLMNELNIKGKRRKNDKYHSTRVKLAR